MAILNIQKKKKDEGAGEERKPASKKTKAVRTKTSADVLSSIEHLSILKNPRITEKVSQLMELNVYTFDVYNSATKDDVKKAIFARYNVMPIKVNMLPVHSKRKLIRGKIGRTSRGKKALVYVTKGDKIEIM